MTKTLAFITLAAVITLTGCSDGKTSLSGKAGLGINNDTLVKGLRGQCKASDIVSSKHSVFFYK